MGGRKDKEKREKALEDQRAVGNTLLVYCTFVYKFSQDSVFGAQKRKPKRALVASSQTLHDQAEEDGAYNRNPLDESPLLQSMTNNTDIHTSTPPETLAHQKVFHASEKTVQSPVKSYKEETGK